MNEMLTHKIVRIGYHVIFWVACFFILFSLFTKDYYNGPIDYAFTFIFIVPFVLAIYIGLYGLRRLVRERHIIWFIVTFIVAVLIGIVGHYLSFDYLSDVLFPDYLMSSYFSIWEVAQYLLVFLGVSSMLKLSKDWFLLKNDQLALQKEHHDVQLRTLKSQLNPHFLFNSLNNIYAMTEDNPQLSKNYILKLSDTLRYMIYETDEVKVPLQNELDYIQDYIELEKLRLADHADIRCDIPSQVSELIAPLILLPFVENCFKYVDRRQPVVHIQVVLEKGILTARFSNTVDISIKEVQKGGVGLSTLLKRLDILYPHKHFYNSTSADGRYEANLQLQLG